MQLTKKLHIDEKYYTIKDLVEQGLGSKATIHRLLRSGKLSKIKLGRSTRIAASEIEKFISLSKGTPTLNNGSKKSSKHPTMTK